MEAFDEFMKSCRKWMKGRNDKNLSEIFEKGLSFFRNLSTNDIELVLSIILDDDSGLLNFLTNSSDKEMKCSIPKGFKLLNFIIEEFAPFLDRYLNRIKEVCRSAIVEKCYATVKNAAVDCLESLIRNYPSNNLELDQISMAFVNELRSSAEKDTNRANLLRALGCIAKYQPEAITLDDRNTIFQTLMNDFDKFGSICGKDSQTQKLKNYLITVDGLLTNFSPQPSDGTSQYYEKLYRCIKCLCFINLTQSEKFVSRAAIRLFGNHMSLFDDFIYDDATKNALLWHSTLLEWSNLAIVENSKIAINVCSIYYRKMGEILTSRYTSSSKKIFEDLKQCFVDNITVNAVSSVTLYLSIRGFGYMAASCKIYSSDKKVEEMFSSIVSRAAVILRENNDMKNSLVELAYCQVTLSQILLELSEVSKENLNEILKLSLILMKRFPELQVTSHALVVHSLVETIHNIKQASSRRMYEKFTQLLVHEGILWSCSHTLHVTAEQKREIENLDELPLCYKNYLRLWQPLICPNQKIFDVRSSVISVKIFHNMIETCVRLIQKLNSQITTFNARAFDVSVAVNESDSRIFVNLVDLFVDILEELNPEFMKSKMDWLICELIKKSHEHSFVSGFYKLIRVVLKLYNVSYSCEPETKLLNDTIKLLSHYLVESIEKSCSFYGELQTSFLAMIFEMPVFIPENMLENLISTFKTAFSLGQSNFILAQSALNALEKWTKNKTGESSKKFLIEVAPSLEPYLQSNETAVDLALPKERKVVKNIVLTNHEKTLREFQRRILLFFGSLDSEITDNFSVPQPSGDAVLSEDRNLLKYTLLFKDLRPDIYLDTILPRTIDLALTSTDRRTRVIACEVLHSIVTVILGKHRELSNPDQQKLLPLFRTICPVLLRLGSDSDQVVQQLFNPLTIQLTHWYSSSVMIESSETDCLIEILFDSLACESNITLSDFCGVCLGEFVKWSIRQSTDTELTRMEDIVGKIINSALHPSTAKRTGAAIAFNYLCAMLSENELIVDKFWLELLFCFIKSLDGCNSPQILKSLKNVQAVIKDKFKLLNAPSERRRKPTEFQGTLLKDAVNWLLAQCGSLDKNCRLKSMEILQGICVHVPGFNSVQDVFTDYVDCNCVRKFNKITLKDSLTKVKNLSAKTMKPILRTLDCYIWIIGESELSSDFLFSHKNVEKDKIFECVFDFVRLLVETEENKGSEFTKQYQELSVLKYEIIAKIFEFAQILVDKMETLEDGNPCSRVLDFFGTDVLFSLISTCLFEPEIFGCCLQNVEIMKTLQSGAERLLKSLFKMLEKTRKKEQILLLRSKIADSVKKKQAEFMDLDKILKHSTRVASKNYLKGLIILQTFDQSEIRFETPIDDDFDPADKVREIFNSLKVEEDGKVYARELESSKKEYLEILLEFLCSKFEANMIQTWVFIFESKTELTQKDSTTILHGEYFMDFFKIPVFRNLLKNVSKTMDTLLSDPLKEKLDIVLLILEDLLIYVKNNKESSGNFVSELESEFLSRFPTFLNSISNRPEDGKEQLVNLSLLLVKVSQNSKKLCSKSEQLYSWIINELLNASDLKYKTRILDKFLPCIISQTEIQHEDQELRDCLRILEPNNFPIGTTDIEENGSLKHSFQTLLRNLPNLKSVHFFECLIDITIDNVEYFWDNEYTKYLSNYFKEISIDDAKKSLQILYKYFKTAENLETRSTILNKLLLKCFHFCNVEAIERFFEQTIKEIYTTVSQDLTDDSSDRKNLILSKIGSYNLLEIMFAQISLETITSVDSKVVKNAIGSVKTGRELLQALNSKFLRVRQLKFINTESNELIRRLHCAAYNCSIAAVSLKNEERFYCLPFAENKSQHQFIWKNIIDTEKDYDFGEDFKELPKEYRKQINIRKQPELTKAHNLSWTKNYDLVGSSFDENLSAFDFHEPQTIAEKINREKMMSLIFESDELNSHECMAPICGIIRHMISKNIFNLPKDGEDSPVPEWMKHFLGALETTAPYNVNLFVIKVILNMQKAFRPYAKTLLNPTLIFLNLHFTKYKHRFNYVIKDILIMLIDWHVVAIPCGNDAKRAQKLLEILIENGDSPKGYVRKYNSELIGNLINVWQSNIEISQRILNILNEANQKYRVRMILAFLLNGKQDSLALNHEVLDHLKQAMNDSDEEIVLNACNAFGLILTFLKSKNELEQQQLMLNSVNTSIKSSEDDCKKYIKRIYEVHIFYPNIVIDYFQKITSKFFKDKSDDYKRKCLAMFLSSLKTRYFTEEKISAELKEIKFQDIATNKIPEYRDSALKIIEQLLDVLRPSDYLPLARIAGQQYSKNAPSAERELMTNIFMAVYKQYSDNIEDNNAVDELKDLSRRILLSGLLDANEDLQRKLIKFWTEDGDLKDESVERMLRIFELYDPKLESDYLPVVPLMMLHLVSEDPEFKKQMFPSLMESKFEDSQVQILCNSPNIVSNSPLFTSSFAQQDCQYDSNGSLNKNRNVLRLNSILSDKTIPQPSRNKQSMRLLSDPKNLGEKIRHEHIAVNIRRDEMLKANADRQRNSIRMCRKYRSGDFPDTEIAPESLIRPLQELVKNDQVIARDLTVAIFRSMVKEMSENKRSDFFEKLSPSLEFILHETQGSKSLVATVMEIILNSREIHVNANSIANISKSSGLLSLGGLLLEEKMISGYTTENYEPARKKLKQKIQTVNDENNDWLQLANIYKSMDDFVVVQIVFRTQKFGDELQKASSAQAVNNWSTAKDAYEKAFEITEDLAKDYCQESLFVCLANLSDWTEINKRIVKKCEEDLETFWNTPKNYENWIAPWVLQAQINNMIRNKDGDGLSEALSNWANTEDKLTRLKALDGEKMAIFYIDKSQEFSQYCLTNGLEKMIQEWKLLNPLYYEQRNNKYLKLRGLSDINTYLKGIKDDSQIIPNLVYWDDSGPGTRDNLLLWDKYVSYRLYFFDLLKNKCTAENFQRENDILDIINSSIIKQCLKIAHVAFDQNSLHLMDKYLQYCRPFLEKGDPNSDIEEQLALAKYEYLRYVNFETPEEKYKAYIASWQVSHKLAMRDCTNPKVQIGVRQHISSLVIALRKLTKQKDSLSDDLFENQWIVKYLPSRNDKDSVYRRLSDYCLAKLEECCQLKNSENKANCYSTVSKYCHYIMNDDSESRLDLSKEFIESTLKAMSYDSLEATQYFPCLLHLNYSQNSEWGEIFKLESALVETWMFLKWQAQLLSHIGTPICSIVAPILLRLAKTYPNSFVYSYRMTREMNKDIEKNGTGIALTKILSNTKDLEFFLDAMDNVVQPELYFKYYISKLGRNTRASNVAASILMRIVDQKTREHGRALLHGSLYKSVEDQIRNLLYKEHNELTFPNQSTIEKIMKMLDTLMKDSRKDCYKDRLVNYSPWLHKFRGENIEVPGQYARDRKPLPQYHAKIVKLNPTVTILPSLRKPIKITMLANDGRNYNFLVKFGEDLRTDERIEQLFVLMNRILQEDAACRRPLLSIETYLVIPLTSSLGLIQWVDNTKSFSEVINLEEADYKMKQRDDIKGLCFNWMKDNSRSDQSSAVIYQQALSKFNRQEVTSKFSELKKQLGCDVLRNAFKILSSSPESFFAFRQSFIRSYATMCIAQWILGIGDRNLQNTLVSYTSGKAVGIDFGYSFDTAVDLCSIPELVPFRLTPQILGLLQPFDEHGLLKVTMINVLRALKRAQDPLRACMDIFIKEPMLEWLARGRTKESSDVRWYPEKKIDVVIKKLNGTKPSRLLYQQIADRYEDTVYLSKYFDVINGVDNGVKSRLRSQLKDTDLSVEEQVECLLDQATDPNILARTWVGWEPWI